MVEHKRRRYFEEPKEPKRKNKPVIISSKEEKIKAKECFKDVKEIDEEGSYRN